MKYILLSLFFLLSYVVRADEPLWTDEQRSAERDCVIEGIVQSVTTIEKKNDFENLMCAEIRILNIPKPHEALKGNSVKVFFLLSPKGAGLRCPDYADPKIMQQAVFYLRHHEYLTGKKDFILDMGSDIRNVKTKEPNQTPTAVTPDANASVAPSAGAAHL